jgi:Concanavalin A-like lectin/glucanases superfamily/PA14 domain
MKSYLYRRLWLSFVLLFIFAAKSHAGSVWQLIYDGYESASNPTQFRESVSTLTNSIVFPYSPYFGEQLDDWYVPAGQAQLFGLQGRYEGASVGTDFGTWIFGYIEAPLTGQYTFCIASADNSTLLLSTNYNPANEVQIAYEPGTGAPLFSGVRLDTRESAPITLVQGQKYYFDIYQQVGPGPGYVQVGWIRPDGVQELIPALHLAQYEGYNDYTGVGPITTPVFNVAGNGNHGGLNNGDVTNQATLVEGSQLLLQLDVIAAQPTTFVWKTNGVVVTNQNLSYFEIDRTPESYNGIKIQAIISNSYGSLTSSISSVTVTADKSAPTILTADTGGNPNLLEIAYSKPVSPLSATNPANYQVTIAGGGTVSLAGSTASLSTDQQTVTFTGAFNFELGTNYVLTVSNIHDQDQTPNTLFPNPTIAPFTLSAPLGATYTFDLGLPSGTSLHGSASIETNSSENPPSGSSFLALTDAATTETGSFIVAGRNDIDQAHISFYTRISDGGDPTGQGSVGGNGFSVNLSANLPTGTFSAPEFGYFPPVIEPQFTVYFNSHTNVDGNGITQPIEIGVSLNDVVLTNIPAGTNYVAQNGVPPITSQDGHWAPVDINLHNDGTLEIIFDGKIILTNFQTGWVGIQGAQLELAASTSQWYETHWIDSLYVNYEEGNVGDAGLAASSVLGGTFPEGSTVQLVAVPTGAGPDTYQWYENGVALSSQTNRILTFPAAVGSGGSFSVAVSNAFSGVVSTPQNVVIQPNLNPPVLVSVSAVAGSINKVFLTFNQTLSPASATAISTYSSPYFSVSSVSLGAASNSVVLSTSQQRYGTTYPLTISGLQDNYAAHNALTTNLTFVSSLSYDAEILGDNPVRYYKLNETNGTVAYTYAVGGDTINTNGTYQGKYLLGQPTLVPSATNDFAVTLVSVTSTNSAVASQVAIPNNGDINVTRGPWPERTVELWFNANSFPIGAQPGNSALVGQQNSVTGLWEEGGNLRDIGIYLWNPGSNTNTNVAQLSFTAYNSTDDGPGSPFGLLLYPAVLITYPVTTNVTYHVVGVLNGDPISTNGELRLYVNGQLVGRSTNGVGQIYDHNGSVHIGSGNGRSHLNVSGQWGYFNGTEQDVSIYNTALSDSDILAHYQAGAGTSLVTTIPPTLVSQVNPLGDPYQLSVVFNQPVSAVTANNLANYVLKTNGGATISLQSAQLQSDLKTVNVKLGAGSSFAAAGNYNVTVGGVADILSATNVVVSTNLSFAFSTTGPIGIAGTSSLTNQTITENQTATFSVVATGQTPYNYQWLYNSAPLAGQTNATLSFIAPWNAGGNYSVVVSNQFSAITNAPPAVLTVLPATTPPQLTGLRGLAGTLNEIVLTFNTPVDPVTATSLATYSIPTAGSTGLQLLSASLSTNGQQVILGTSTQVHGQVNQITITNLKDRSHIPNTLTVTAQFTSSISYRDEVLATPGLVRYFTFDETNGSSSVNSLVSKYDTSPLNIVGTVRGTPALPTLGVPGLVPNVPNDTAINFNGVPGTNRVELPNGADINSTLGPWYQITTLFYFEANALPQIQTNSAGTATNYQVPVLFSDLQYAVYLFPTQTSNNPSQAQLVFEGQNTSSQGAGSPWGGNASTTSKYIAYTITTNQVYQVATVLDGTAGFTTGELRLYVDGVRVGTVTGIGAIYQQPNNSPGFGQGYVESYNSYTKTINPELVTTNVLNDDAFNGVIDEFAYINQGTLSDARIAQLYSYSQTNALGTNFALVQATQPAPPLNFSFHSELGGLNLSWGTNTAGYYLESTTNLGSGIWVSNALPPTVIGRSNTLNIPTGTNNQFFRLIHP